MQVITIEPESIFQALSDQIRIRILRLLVFSKSEVCLCELSESLAEPEYKLSRHVKILRQSGLLSAEKDGRWIYHRLAEKSPNLKLLYKFVRDLPDATEDFKLDLARLEKCKKSRNGGRCRPPQISVQKTSAKQGQA